MPVAKKIVVKVPCHHCKTPMPEKELIRKPSGRLWCKGCDNRWNPIAVHTRSPKPVKLKIKTGFCVTCDKRFPLSKLTKCKETFQLYCEEHVPGGRRKKIDKSDTFGWYVLACEPGSEGRVKKNLLRKLRIENGMNLVKKLIIARQFEDRIVPVRGESVHEEGGFGSRMDALAVAKVKCQQICRETGIEHRYSAFPDKAEEKGKESNTWQFRISTIPEAKEMRTIGVKRYPGYIICKLDATPEFGRILKKVGQQWGLLLQPVHQNFTVSVTYSKRKGGWMWKVKGDGKTLIFKGGPKDNRSEAVTAGQDAKAKAMEVKPVPLKTEEAAREMLNQKVFGQLTKDKETREKATVNFRRGSKVEVIYGEFAGQQVQVTSIDRSDKKNVQVWIDVMLCGQPVPYAVPYWHLQLLKY